jgi:hypothetical protein
MIPSKKIIYVTREIERALGMEPGDNYLIAADRTPYAETIQNQFGDHVLLIDSPAEKPFGTGDLLKDERVKKLVSDNGGNVLVFKNTPRIEPFATANGWTLLNPKAALGEQVENKLTQIEWLGAIGKEYLPEHRLQTTRFIKWNGQPFIVQWGHGHTGSGTMLISSAADLSAIQARFPERMARVSAYVRGPSFTVNAVVASDKIMISSISYQITGLPPFTDNAFTTIGNDWAVANKILSADDMEVIESITRKIGVKLNVNGWRGLFGVDVIRDEKTGKICLIEINARQTASIPFESFLQKKARLGGAKGLTTFEAHLKALLGEKIDQELISIKDGAQIIQRVIKNARLMPSDIAKKLESAGFQVVSYVNSKEGEDLIRIQSMGGIMDGHEKFNEKGSGILKILKQG